MTMKLFHRHSLLSLGLSLGLVATASASPMSPMEVKVSHASGKVVYQGESNSAGTFNTPQLSPGNYVVQLNAKSAPKGGPISLVIDDTGKGSTVANAVPAAKFAKGGVAMKIEIGPKPMSITGHLTHGPAAASTSTVSHKPGVHMENGKKVKYENGKKYVWAEGISAMGGHWALADSPEAKNTEPSGKSGAPAHDGDTDH